MVLPFLVLVPKIGRGFGKGRVSGPSPETLPLGESRGGTAAMLKSSPKGRGITRQRSAGRRTVTDDGDTPLGAVFQGCGGGPAVPFFFVRCSGVRLVRTPCRAPPIVTRRADRRCLGRACDKGVFRLGETEKRPLAQLGQGDGVPGGNLECGTALPKAAEQGPSSHSCKELKHVIAWSSPGLMLWVL